MLETGTAPIVTATVFETLAAHERYARLARSSLQALVEAGEPRSLQPGEAILHQEQTCSSVFIVLRGRLKMTRTLATGRSVFLALYSPGDPVGLSVLGGRPSASTVSAIESSICLEIPGRELLATMAADPQLLGDLLAVFTERVSECNNCLIEGAFARVEARLARLFLKLGESVGEVRGEAVFVPVRLSRMDLADMTGTSIETVIRIMSRWGKNRVVETCEDGFSLQDRDSLVSICTV